MFSVDSKPSHLGTGYSMSWHTCNGKPFNTRGPAAVEFVGRTCVYGELHASCRTTISADGDCRRRRWCAGTWPDNDWCTRRATLYRLLHLLPERKPVICSVVVSNWSVIGNCSATCNLPGSLRLTVYKPCKLPTVSLGIKSALETLMTRRSSRALSRTCRLKAVLQLLAVVCLGDTNICRKSIWRPPSCCIE